MLFLIALAIMSYHSTLKATNWAFPDAGPAPAALTALIEMVLVQLQPPVYVNDKGEVVLAGLNAVQVAPPLMVYS